MTFFAVFTAAVDAITASADAQRGLTDHEWPADGPVPVRALMRDTAAFDRLAPKCRDLRHTVNDCQAIEFLHSPLGAAAVC